MPQRVPPIPVNGSRLTVISFSHSDGTSLWWNCSCSCGGQIRVRAYAIRGYTRSCGCLRREASAIHAKTMNRSHGLGKPPEYAVWANMLQRCTNPKNRSYKRYGGRGIKVCDRWLKFENFYADIPRRPSPIHSLDRYPDNNGDYEPGNVRWATDSEQAHNKTNNVNLTYLGETHCLTEWARILGIPLPTLHNRLRVGWSVEETLGTPSNNPDMLLTHEGWTLSITEWAKILGVKKRTIYSRIKRGWTPGAALTQKTHRGVRCRDL